MVFLADLTDARLISTVWVKWSKNSYLHEFFAQVSQIVFWADLTVLQVFATIWEKKVTKLISLRVLCTSKKNRVPSWFKRFTAYYNCKAKMSQNSYLREFYAQVSHLVILSDLTVLHLFTTVWVKMSKLISPRFSCTSFTNRVLSWFDRFTACYNCMRENITKLISPQVLCTRVTNRVVRRFDRFTAYYNCMSKIVTNLISPRVLCTRITDRVSSWNDHFTAY